MEWRRTEARIVTMLHTCHVTPVHHWRLRLIESELRRAIEMKPAPPIVTATGVDRRTREEWHWQMQCRHLELMELEQSFRVLFEPDPTNVDTIEQPSGVPDITVELTDTEKLNVGASTVELQVPVTVEQQHVPPQNPGETTEQQHVPLQNPVKLQLPATVELELSSPIFIQHCESLLTEVSPAQSESELMDDEEACVVDDIDAHYGFSVLGVLPTDRPPPEPGQELMDKEACAVDATDGDRGFPVRVLPTDRPPPEPDQQQPIDEEEACTVFRDTTIDAFSTPIQHGYTVEKPLRGYALPAPQQTASCRPPPKPGDVSRETRAYGSTTATRRTIRLKASRRDRLGRVTARNGTEREGGRRTVKGEG